MMRNLRFAAVYVALAAMMLRALLPAGWMPGVNAGTPLVVCTMNGPVSLALGPDGKPLKHQPSQDDARHHEMCPFAGAPNLASPSTVAGIIPPSHVVAAARDISDTASFAGTAQYSRQSPRAPPFLV